MLLLMTSFKMCNKLWLYTYYTRTVYISSFLYSLFPLFAHGKYEGGIWLKSLFFAHFRPFS